MQKSNLNNDNLPQFDRQFFSSREKIMCIGEGSLGGKASGLNFVQRILKEKILPEEFPSVEVTIPRLVVLRTQIFDQFMERNDLHEKAYSNLNDLQIIYAFQQAELPVEILGDLRSLVENVHIPLAVRSSSLLEDAKYEPLAGIYSTKMIPNNQANPDERFRKLIDAIKFVYASTFFKSSKDYFDATSHDIKTEKMAVIIQEVEGNNYGERFYPNISGVIKSYNFYPTGNAKPEQGIVNLALGLGKTIVDGGTSWSYSIAYPNSIPPFADVQDMLENTQTKFWAINMNPFIEYNPVAETEFMFEAEINNAEYDGTLNYIASTYDPSSDRIKMGIGTKGIRCLNFSQLLTMNEFKFNNVVRKLLKICEEAMNGPVEIEFAANILQTEKKMHLAFLQVRPLALAEEVVDLTDEEMEGEEVLIASCNSLGNGVINNINDIVFVKPETFDKKDTRLIASEIATFNRELIKKRKPYLLIGFGRWGSYDPWLGIPVEWPQIAGAKVIVEANVSQMNVQHSQGSHFFHNLTSQNVSYISIDLDSKYKIDWDWINKQQTERETEFVKHVSFENPLQIKVDGKTSRGIIRKSI